ncbi:MAG: ribonuclease P protein component [Dehalococcoidia bacterium]
MGKDIRLRTSREFATVLKWGKRWSNDLLVLRVHPNGLEVNRYGISVGKGLGKAVLRNRFKRRIRESVRELSTRKGWDLVLIGRRDATNATYKALKEALQDLLRSAGLLCPLVAQWA